LVFDVKAVALLNLGRQRRDELLVDLDRTMTPQAQQVVMVFGRAGRVGVYVSGTLETARQTDVDKGIEVSENCGSANVGVFGTQFIKQLLRGHRCPMASQRFENDDALRGEFLAACGQPGLEFSRTLGRHAGTRHRGRGARRENNTPI
jgi:hypothetical protein